MTYTYGHTDAVVDVHAARTAAREAAFLLPHLRPGMRLLDVGCGPGTITLGLAAAVAPGSSVGLDLEPGVLERGRREADARGVRNLRFEVGQAYALPFPDGSFDAVFAHTLLEHVDDPPRALREARRVLVPGGVLGVRDCDWGSGVFAPADPLVAHAMELYARVWRHNGGHPHLGRELRALLLATGFTRVVSSASFRWDGSWGDSRSFGRLLADRLALPNFADPTLRFGWSDPDSLHNTIAACRAWSERPDAFAAMVMVEAVGWVE
jgi:SAM-dependent methyltransferase